METWFEKGTSGSERELSSPNKWLAVEVRTCNCVEDLAPGQEFTRKVWISLKDLALVDILQEGFVQFHGSVILGRGVPAEVDVSVILL